MGEKRNHSSAWNAFNAKSRNIEVEYDKEMNPIREELEKDLSATQKRFDEKINPLVAQRNKALADLRSEALLKMQSAWKKRNDAIAKAREILQQELKANEMVIA